MILLFGLTGLIDWLDRAVPKSVVRGLQLAVGLSLLMKGIQMVVATQAWFAPDSYLTGLLAAVLVLLLFFSRRVPAALVLFGCGLVVAVWTHPGAVSSLGIGFTLPSWTPPAWQDFKSAFRQGCPAADTANHAQFRDRGLCAFRSICSPIARQHPAKWPSRWA